ncbi:siderophore biosynthesis protein PsvB, partial [Vibrio parahaemolyticus]|nr:siderophore biosynthesis protein PsvB [Vibrio parahaemolyticus]
MNDNALYLTQRLIDTCLREDMFGILSRAKFSSDAPKEGIVPQGEQVWLIFANSDFTLYLPVAPTYYMQHWRYGHANDETTQGWWVEKNGQVEHQQHYKEWIALLTTLAHDSSHELLAG